MYSFDVYDTLITRNVAEPKDIFGLMCYVIESNDVFSEAKEKLGNNFQAIRVEAEKTARVMSGQEITLDDIYMQIKKFSGLSGNAIVLLKNLEIDTETNNAIGIQSNIDKVKGLLDEGQRVILISDMYLPKSVYKKIFEIEAPVLNNLTLYLSSEEGATKESGLLYALVGKKEQVDYSEWIHVGDNHISDGSIPELFGIKPLLYDRKKDSINTNAANSKISVKASDGLETAKKLLASKKDLNYESRGYWLGYKYIGIPLYSFVSWILNIAIQKKITKLYFVMRDGYILKQIADIIIDSNKCEIQTYYLYGSRTAWNPTSDEELNNLIGYLRQEIGNNSSDDYALVDAKGTGRSINYLAKLLGQKITVFYYCMFEPIRCTHINPFVYTSEGYFIEHFCRAPLGPTIGYRKEDGKYIPVLGERASGLLSETIDEYVRGAKDFTKEYCSRYSRLDFDLYETGNTIMRDCYIYPTFEVASVIGDIPQDDDNEDRLYAPKLEHDDIYKIEVIRTTEPQSKYYNGADLQYSYKRLDIVEIEWLDTCRNNFFESNITDKSSNALKIAIYAYGVYGKELYHRLYANSGVDVVAVVDANYMNCKSLEVNVEKLSVLRDREYDFVVIALVSKKKSDNVKRMLVSAGVIEAKILYYKDFCDKYIG